MIHDISKLKIGDKVHYIPQHYKNIPIVDKDNNIIGRKDKYENGIVKEIPKISIDSIRVVYNCNGDYYNFKDYTSALTNVRDLELGWRHE